MLFCIRETLISNWGRGKSHTSLLTGKAAAAKISSDDKAEKEAEAPRATRSSSKKKASSKDA